MFHLQEQKKGQGTLLFLGPTPYFVALPSSTLLFNALFCWFFGTKLVFTCFGIICKSLKKRHKSCLFKVAGTLFMNIN